MPRFIPSLFSPSDGERERDELEPEDLLIREDSRLSAGPLCPQRNMNNAAGAGQEQNEKPTEPRKPQNPEALRVQEQKVTHDKVGELPRPPPTPPLPSPPSLLAPTSVIALPRGYTLYTLEKFREKDSFRLRRLLFERTR